MVLSHVISEIFNVEKYRQRSVKVIESYNIRSITYCFLFVFYSNFFPKSHRFVIFDL